MSTDEINWGPTGALVYERTYSRTKPDGSKETWPETVERVVDGNLSLVPERHHLEGEREQLIRLMTEFKIIPAGRHLWASGVKNAQHLFNCWVSGWTDKVSDHFAFTFLRLMEGGGVGSNYSNSFLADYPIVPQDLLVDIVCDPGHPDYEVMKEAGVLSNEYHPDWVGSYQIEDSREGWAAALVDLIDTHYRDEVEHYHRVYDVSRVRPAGSKLRTFGGTASGPLPLARMLKEVNGILASLAFEGWRLTGLDAMEIDHAIAQCVVAGGVRRSARMAMMHWKDPQIGKFMRIKQASGSHWTTNISVEVDRLFWESLSGSACAPRSHSRTPRTAGLPRPRYSLSSVNRWPV
ncbi:ribonucleoside-triphosphate reductase, adenosylcobalamin-dependent [Mycobacterium avium subsp. hominissuis]|uniref:ribonucleoside-triphosphate reductase, adenosylcobalamin-dependent n=1 Tax=Mycobacterium avium TaxID=1764 RepID=UPI001CE0A70F|nr:ribonucleoside-triphosphate reductase, adenosylcobalamin-dependent [Mycobacterium avium]MCA4761925.1 ribonucleoside-triphosphate reductase, adenosylcobalamin-dependent [Mycobacterium avium subsp. hominissuis]